MIATGERLRCLRPRRGRRTPARALCGSAVGDSLVGNAQFDSVLAKKLNSFLPLTSTELEWLAEIQATPLKVKRGKQLTQEG
jgi:hypothetical protein